MAAAAQGRPHQARGERPVPNTPEARRHAREAHELQAAMQDYRIRVERVAPTISGEGHIRMNFATMHWILDMLDHAYNGVPPELSEATDLR